MTTMGRRVFAGGDVTRGPDEVIKAISDGKRARDLHRQVPLEEKDG